MAVSQRTPQLARVGFWSTGIAVFTAWNVAILGGALGGTAIGDPQDYGLDAAVGAAFLALLWSRLDGSGPWIAATLAVTLALATVPVLTPGLPVLVAGVVALLIARRPPSQEPAKTRTEQP
ncbi:hypothetical protein BH24ACT11_BH24ACT11_07700 [soil metagenome]